MRYEPMNPFLKVPAVMLTWILFPSAGCGVDPRVPAGQIEGR